MGMRYIFAALIFCTISILTAGCVPEEHIYIKVLMPVNLPPIIKVSDSPNFSTPAPAYSVNVYVYDPEATRREFYWSVFSGKHETNDSEVPYIINPPIDIWEVVYGVVPKRFVELDEALPLKPGCKYGVQVFGDIAESETVYFNYKSD